MQRTARPPITPRLTKRALAALLPVLAAAPPAASQSEQSKAPVRKDQVFAITRRGAPATYSGVVVANELAQVRLDEDGREKTVDSDLVVRIQFGDVPNEYKLGLERMDRGDYENALARLREAATDAEARDVVKAAARLRSAECLMGWAAVDPNKFAESLAEAERFLSDYPSNREVPLARRLKARATWLGGDAATAGGLFRALFEEGASDPPTTGYDRLDCMQAGLLAARALLDAKETLTPREIFRALENAIQDMLAKLEESDGRRDALEDLLLEAQAGEGYVLLAAGQVREAKNFFEGQARGTNGHGVGGSWAIKMGLAETLFAEKSYRAAQVEFAKVAALDPSDRDRRANALVRLSECAKALGDAEADRDAQRWLEEVTTQYGDTPAAPRARSLLAGK
jgi:tetratricopeptide (TPR) repeat protein